MTNESTFIKNLSNPFLKDYMQYVEHTEAPRIMHLWAAITTASACLGRHSFFSFGIGDTYPNLYTLLVGPPATKKSTTVTLATKLAQEVTNINFAPDDTAGQRQGLITAIESGGTNLDEELEDLSGKDILNIFDNLDVSFDSPDRHAIFIEAREWGSFIGQNNIDLVRFLIKLYDGDDYRYALRKSKHLLKKPLATMLGCTTPTDISILLPPEVIGQGFMSRIILVFDAKKYKSVFRPKLNMLAAARVKETFRHLWHESHGPVTETAAAYAVFEKLHEYQLKINDTRFVYYAERRPTHLIKLALILAACRRSKVIDSVDVNEAHYILLNTEHTMADALGEYGLSPEAKARQRLLEYIRHADTAIPVKLLWFTVEKDMRRHTFDMTLNSLEQTGRIKILDEDKDPKVIYREDRRDNIIDLFEKAPEC